MKKIILTFLILILLVTPVTAVRIIPRTESSWTCFDYSVQYAKDHPEWGIVTLSSHGFRGVSHMVNYQFAEAGSLMIHDGLYGIDYNLYEWENMYSYHFWVNGERPVRNYIIMQDNSYIVSQSIY